MSRKTITVKGAADILGVTAERIHKYVKKGKLSTTTKKKKIYVYLDEIQEFKKRQGWRDWLPERFRSWSIFGLIIVLIGSFLSYLGIPQKLGSEAFEYFRGKISSPRPIMIIPNEIEFIRGKGSGRAEFNVYNSSDQTLFNRSIQILIEDSNVDYDEIKVKEIRESDERPKGLDDNGLPKHFKIKLIGGLIDEDGKKYNLLLIPQLGPKETKIFRVFFIPKDDPARKGTVKLFLKPNEGPEIKSWVIYKEPGENIGLRPYIVTLRFKGVNINTMFDKSNNAWFFADHVGKILQLGAPQDFLKLLEYKETGKIILEPRKGEKVKQLLVAHYGIHKLVKNSPSLQAEEFEAWAARTVPQIGKHSVPQK